MKILNLTQSFPMSYKSLMSFILLSKEQEQYYASNEYCN